MTTYYAKAAGSILAANAWNTLANGTGTDATFADGNASGHVLDLNALAMTSPTGTTLTCATLQATTGTLTPTGTLAITVSTGVIYSGTSTGGMIIVGTGAELTVTGGGAGTTAVKATAAGYAILVSDTGTATVSNSGGTWACWTSSTGRAISASGSGAVIIVGHLNEGGGGNTVVNASTSTGSQLTGNITSSQYGATYILTNGTLAWEAVAGSASIAMSGSGTGISVGNSGVLNMSGSFYNTNTANSSNVSIRVLGTGILNWTGSVSIADGTSFVMLITGGTCNLATASAELTMANSGNFIIMRSAGTLTTVSGAHQATITQQSSTAACAIFGGITNGTLANTVIGPVIPLATHVYPKGLGLAFGYAGVPVLGTLRASNIGSLSAVASSEDLVAGDLADDVIVDNVTGTLAAGGGGLLRNPGMSGGIDG